MLRQVCGNFAFYKKRTSLSDVTEIAAYEASPIKKTPLSNVTFDNEVFLDAANRIAARPIRKQSNRFS
jgi:hypothetical protein